MPVLLLAFLLAALPARAEDAKAAPTPADKTTLELVDYFLKVPTSEANPKLVAAFLAVDGRTLPKKLRLKAGLKQAEIRDLIKLRAAKKGGSLVQPDAVCTGEEMVRPLAEADIFLGGQYEEIDEDELKYVMDKTHCTELDLGCRFSLKIFFTKSVPKQKPRRMGFLGGDPIMGLIAESRGKGGSTHFFGFGLSCLH